MKRIAFSVLAASASAFAFASAGSACRAEVRFAGRRLKVESCRVSAVPFNRIWPGRQRSLDQTRLSAFVGFDVPDGGGLLELDFGENVPKTARIRPFSRGQPTLDGGVWRVKVARPEQFVVEFGDGGELHVFADPPWTDVPDGPNVMRFGPGEHHVGAIIPGSGTTVVVERGATVYGNIVLTEADDVRVVGRGIIDGSGNARTDAGYAGSRHLARNAGRLPEMIEDELHEWGTTPLLAVNCRRLKVEGVTFRDSPRWTMNIEGCDGVDIRGVKIVGMWRYNSDGIDMCGTKNAVVADSFVRSFDDCVIARPPFCGMSVSNCVLWCDWGHNMKVQHADRPSVMEGISFADIKAVNVDALLASVTTRYGSTNCTIRGVSFRNIEVDVPAGRLAGRVQADDAQGFEPTPATRLRLLDMYAYSLGVRTPNQGAPVPVCEDSLRLLYEDVSIDGVRVYTAPGEAVEDAAPFSIECRVRTCTGNFEIRDVSLRGLPRCTKLVKDAAKGTIADVELR